MILIDFSQTSISNLHQHIKNLKNNNSESALEPKLFRHMILHSIRKINREFSKKYGKLVICADNDNYWRKEIFPFYKANRKVKRDTSEIDWKLVYSILKELREEIKDNFPYKVMDVAMAEADDVIAILTKHFHQQEPIVICSGDHDFQQLQKYPNVAQYAPNQDKYIFNDNPDAFLKEHILRGDNGDGIPNFLSDDDCLVVKEKRQKSIFEKKLVEWVKQTPKEICGDDENLLKNYSRNRKLVDFSQIPDSVENSILEEFKIPPFPNKSKIYSYLIKHKMVSLLNNIGDF